MELRCSRDASVLATRNTYEISNVSNFQFGIRTSTVPFNFLPSISSIDDFIGLETDAKFLWRSVAADGRLEIIEIY